MEQNNNGKGLAIAALVCGILGIVGAWIPVVDYFTLVLSILGIIFGALGRKKLKAAGQPAGMATAGLVLGIISVACGVIGIVCVGAVCGAATCATV